MNLSTPGASGMLCTRVSASGRRRAAGGFTLVEMLVSLAITLIMMGAVVTLFGVISDSVSGSRTAIEMADRLRTARDQLQLDLQGATATMRPPLRPEMDEGYFEIIEGPMYDDYARSYAFANNIQSSLEAAPPPASWTLFGDLDDVLMFTVRSRGAPFLGKLGGNTVIESPVAEVIYFLVQDGPLIDASVPDASGFPQTRLCTLYRRVLLVAPATGNVQNPSPQYYSGNDLSVRFEELNGTPTLIPNTLGDLTKRENRFAHYGLGTYQQFPFLVDLRMLPTVPFQALPAFPTRSDFSGSPPFPPGRPDENAFIAPFNVNRLGDDVLLTNVLAFDVQVWDPTAEVRVDAGIALEPHDPRWSAAGAAVAAGAYVDLGYAGSDDPVTKLSVFSNVNPDRRPRSAPASLGTSQGIYDTWSLHYESNGFNEDQGESGDVGTDTGTNGLDDNNNGIVDDIGAYNASLVYSGEYDTLPPYRAPLRGIRVTIRVYEPNSKTVREAVVIQNFNTK